MILLSARAAALLAAVAIPVHAQPSSVDSSTTPRTAVATTVPASFSAGYTSLGSLTPGQRLALAGYQATSGKARAHREAIAATGVGTHFGDHSSFHKLTPEKRREWIAGKKKPGTNPAMPRQSSCIDWALECVQAAYDGVGRGSEGRAAVARCVAEQGRGTVLARELIARGWIGVYWNPDTLKPNDNDKEHTFSAMKARTSRTYYGLRVRHLLVDYRPTDGSPTEKDTSGLEKLAKVPFWFGVARGGKHTFVGYGATLSEFHWTYEPDSPGAIDERPFEGFGWNSGLIVVPPDTWPSS